jgi:hypothetical protein
MNSIAAPLDVDNWQTGGIKLDIHLFELEFPAWF